MATIYINGNEIGQTTIDQWDQTERNSTLRYLSAANCAALHDMSNRFMDMPVRQTACRCTPHTTQPDTCDLL